MEQTLIFLGVLALLVYTWKKINPILDYNTETEEEILWYNDPFNSCKRKFITLWKTKKN